MRNSNIYKFVLISEDCVMSNWGDWSPCDPSCLNSKPRPPPPTPTRWHNRHIIQQPLRDGITCPSEMIKSEECQLCKEDAESKEEETGARQCFRYCPGRLRRFLSQMV